MVEPKYNPFPYEMSELVIDKLKNNIVYKEEKELSKKRQYNGFTKEREFLLDGHELSMMYDEEFFTNNIFETNNYNTNYSFNFISNVELNKMFSPLLEKVKENNPSFHELENYKFNTKDIMHSVFKERMISNLTEYLTEHLKEFPDNVLTTHLGEIFKHKNVKYLNNQAHYLAKFFKAYKDKKSFDHDKYTVYALNAEWLELTLMNESNFVFSQEEEPLLVNYDRNYFIVTKERMICALPYYENWDSVRIIEMLIDNATQLKIGKSTFEENNEISYDFINR